MADPHPQTFSPYSKGVAVEITKPPDLSTAQIYIEAFNSKSAGYTLCSSASQHIASCLGVAEKADNFTGPAFVNCACCNSQVNFATVYASCDGMISRENAPLRGRVSEFAKLVTGCSAEASACKETKTVNVFTKLVPTRTIAQPSIVSSHYKADVTVFWEDNADRGNTTEDYSKSIRRRRIGITPPPERIVTACTSMAKVVESCMAKTPGFAEMRNSQQAPCYCCRTSDGVIQWHNELGRYASGCDSWASTGDPYTIYPIASTFSMFCDQFTDACLPSDVASASAAAAYKNTNYTALSFRDAATALTSTRVNVNLSVLFGGVAIVFVLMLAVRKELSRNLARSGGANIYWEQ